MEPIGLTVGVIGLAGLFSVCLDVIDKVDSYKDYGVKSRSIVALFEGYKHLFKKWAQDINGPAGHGKTILYTRVVQYLSSILESPLAYYFCSLDSKSRRDSSTIIRSWISQVISCNRDAFELAYVRWEAKDRRNASQTDIIDLFKTIAEEKWKSNYDDSPLGFFESIKGAVAHTTTRILILSRDEPEIRYGFRTVLVDDSSQGLNEYQIRPDDVRSDAMLFSQSIEKVLYRPEKDKLRALSILRWAAFALRPLTILEITKALLIVDNDCEDLLVDERPDAIDEEYVRDEILGLCGSLIETQKAVAKQDLGFITIHLAHFSVKQYILCNMPA
ncbi:ankyrin-1 [Halenospora varia]|nr:ankyrin-1 [Halenospora varia]